MIIPVVLNSMVSGVLFYTAYQFLFIGLRNRKHPEYITFGFIVLFQVICALIELFGLLSDNQHAYLIYRHFYYNITAVINVLIFLFISIVSGYRHKFWMWAYLFFVIVTFILINTTSAIIFVNQAPHYQLQIIATHFFKPWTVSVTPLFGLATLLQYIILAIYSLLANQFQRTTHGENANFIMYSLLLFILGSISNLAIDLGIIHYPISSYFYLILIIYMSNKLYKNIENADRFKDEANQGEQRQRQIIDLVPNSILLETILEDAPVAMILIDNKSEVLKINKAASELGLNSDKNVLGRQLGHAFNCIVTYNNEQGCGSGKKCSECILRSSIQSTFANKTGVQKMPYKMSVKHENADVHFNILISTSYLEINNSSMALVGLENITPIMKTEKALMDSEFRYRQITRAITDYIYTVIIQENDEIQTIHTLACFFITGYRAEEFEVDPSLWFNIVVDEDREKVLNFIRSGSQEKQSIEYRIICKGGKERWVSNTLVKKKKKSREIQYDGIIRIITKRKRAEEALDQQNKLLNTMLDNLPIGIFMVKAPEGNPLIANEQAKKLLGKGILPDVNLTNLSDVYKAFEAGTNQPYPTNEMPIIMGMHGKHGHIDDLEVELPDGTRNLLEIVGCPVYDTNNNIWASLVGFYDITARKNIELALRESEKRLSITFEYSHVGISLSDNNGNIQYMNPAFCKLLDYQPDQIIKNDFQLFNHLKDDAEIELFDKLRKGELNMLNFEKKYIKKQGEEIWVQMQVSCFRNVKGEVTNFIAVVEDITERKNASDSLRASEEKFRNIFNISNDANVIIDFEGYILEVNQIFLDRTGLTMEQLKKMRLIDIASPIDQEESENKLKNLIKNKTAFFQISYINQRGEKIYVEMNGRTIHYNGEQAALLVSRDITERVISQQKIMNAIIGAEEKERSFFSQELHDGLGPILSTIKLYMEWIQNPDAKSDKSILLKDALNTVEEAIASVKEISNRLSPNVLKKFGVETALQSFIKKIESVGKVRFDVRMNLPERIQPEIEAMLYRVFVEAINNSLKYANASNIVIQIGSNPHGLFGLFRDDGIGFNIHEILTQKKGHGLFNMQNRVETYEGSFSLKSAPGQGTEIEIEIPSHKYILYRN